MRKLTPDEISKTGMYGVWRGQVTNKWQLTDEKTGELIEGAKMSWMGGNGSARFGDPSQMDHFKEGDLIEVEVQLTENRGSYKPGKGRLVSVNGTVINHNKKTAV